MSSTSPLAVLQVVAIAYKLQGEALFAWNAALQEGTLLFFDAFQAPVAQHFAVAGGQAQRYSLERLSSSNAAVSRLNLNVKHT